jgi:hypothetical protein
MINPWKRVRVWLRGYNRVVLHWSMAIIMGIIMWAGIIWLIHILFCGAARAETAPEPWAIDWGDTLMSDAMMDSILAPRPAVIMPLPLPESLMLKRDAWKIAVTAGLIALNAGCLINPKLARCYRQPGFWYHSIGGAAAGWAGKKMKWKPIVTIGITAAVAAAWEYYEWHTAENKRIFGKRQDWAMMDALGDMSAAVFFCTIITF